MTDIALTDTPHGLHLDVPGSPGLTISSDEVAAIVQHELGKLGLWWAEEQRALVVTAPHAIPEHRQVLVARGPGETGWVSTLATIGLDNPASRALAAYLATLPPAVPKPGETWEIGTGADTHTAIVVEAPDGSACFVWRPHGDIAIRHVSRFEGCRRKIADAPTTALDKVRGALAEHPRCDRHGADDPVTCGWKSAVLDVQAALDGADS